MQAGFFHLLLVFSTAAALLSPSPNVRFVHVSARSRAATPRLGVAEVAKDVAGAVDTSNIVKAQSNRAWNLLEQRIANSRVGPIASAFLTNTANIFTNNQRMPAWASALWDAVYQPLDIFVIVVLLWGSKPLLQALHSALLSVRMSLVALLEKIGLKRLWARDDTDTEAAAGEDNESRQALGDLLPITHPIYSFSLLAALEEPLRNAGRLLASLYALDIIVYVLGVTKLLSKGLAGALPAAIGDASVPLLAGSVILSLKSWFIRRRAGVGVHARLNGDAALADRLWGAFIWLWTGWICSQIIRLEMGFRVKSLLAIGGLSSVVIGLACQTPLSNVVQGLVIAVSSPFAAGDRIALNGGKLIAVVEDFGWYQTRLRTLSDEVITLPNSALATKQVSNLSRRNAKQLVATLRVRYADIPKVDELIDALREMAAEMPSVARVVRKGGKRPEIHLWDYGKTAVEIRCKVHIGPFQDEKQLKQRFLLQCADVMAKHGVQFQPVPVVEME